MSADHIGDRIAPFTQAFGPLLRRYRLAAGLTQEELAERAGLSVRGISDLERERKLTPRRETVRLLAEALALPPRKRALLEAAARPLTAASSTPAATPLTPPLDLQPLTPPHNLPTQLTALIGRERETRALTDALRRDDTRLLTLTGPGGVGKTRLALQVAEDALADFDDGVYFVSLAALRAPDYVTYTIGETLGLRPTPGESLDQQVTGYLAEKRLLLVIDNFEQVVEAAPQLATLLAACPRVKALVTSREALRLDGEQIVPIAPLADEAARELFVRRALAVNPALELAPADRELIDAICQRVDRLPLAIELAASWTRTLNAPSLLDQLSRPLDLLTGGRRDAPARHQTLRETIAWSDRLLAPDERRLFRRLAVFAGGATRAAAETVCGATAGLTTDTETDGTARATPGDVDEDEAPTTSANGSAAMLTTLARLVEQSLLLVDQRQDEAHYRMLDTIREYAREELRASGELPALQRRHAEYFARMTMDLGFVQRNQDARDRRLTHEMPNIRAALQWTIEANEPALGLRLATPLGRYWYSHGAFDEGGRWLRALLALDAQAGDRAVTPRARVWALYSLILIALDQHDFDQAEALGREGLTLARAVGDGAGVGNMLTELGHVAEARGDLDAALALFEEGLASFRASSQDGAVGRTLSSLGNLQRTRGDYAEAQRYLEESLAWARARNFSWAAASGLVSLGHVACEQGEGARALALYHESLEYYQTTPNPATLAWCLEGVVVAISMIRPTESPPTIARFAGAIVGLRQRAGVAPAPDWPPFTRALVATQQTLGPEAYVAAHQAGTALTPERIVAEALAVSNA